MLNRDAAYITENSYADADGILRWHSNDNPVPTGTFTDYGAEHLMPAGQAEAVSKAAQESIAAYVKAQQDWAQNDPQGYAEAQAEMRQEARAAHGPGVELVDVLTGERWTT